MEYYDIPTGGKLTEEERRHLEQKLSRRLEWVGAWIPDNLALDHDEIPLHQVLWNIIKKDQIGEKDMELLISLEERLNKKFREDVDSLEHRDELENQAIHDYCEALGILRAILTIKDIEKREEKSEDKDEFTRKMNESTKNHEKYWLDFLKQTKEVG